MATLEFLWPSLVACLLLTGIHVYLGLHVLARGIIFVDLALAQLAALGITVAFLAGHPIQSAAAYWYALLFTLGGAGLFSLARARRLPIPQEAFIGIVYAVSAALAVLIVDRAPLGGEHLKQLLVGSILTVPPRDLAALTLLYALIGALHWLIRKPLLEISFDPERAAERGRRFAGWDFVFYASFGLVVTSSVRIAGVLLVFSFLIVPGAMAALFCRSIASRLLLGWGLGALVSVVGLLASATWDLPTGAAVVATFGGLFAAVILASGAHALVRQVRASGVRALRDAGLAASIAVGLGGLLLLVRPQMDHPWLTWIEDAMPTVELAFLTPRERLTYWDSRHALTREIAERERLRALRDDVQWGKRPMNEDAFERLRQFLASQGEITAGDRMVLATLREKARARQRYWLGAPLFVGGGAGALVLVRRRRTLSSSTRVIDA